MPPRLTLPRTRLLRHDLEYQAVYAARMKKARGGLAVFTMPTERVFHRLGLAVSKRGRTGIARNRVKRLIREAFRLEQHSLTPLADPPRSYDIVVSASAEAADTLTLEAVRATLKELIMQADRAWQRRGASS